VLVIAGILALVVWKIDLNKVMAVTIKAMPMWLLASLVLSIVIRAVSPLAWKMLVAAQGLDISTSRLVVFHYASQFFSNFTPSKLGGDVSRAYFLSKWTARPIESSTSVMVLKVCSITSLFLMSIVASLYARELPGAQLLLAVFFVALVLVLALLLFGRLGIGRTLLTNRDGWLGRVLSWWPQTKESLVRYRHAPTALAGAFAWFLIIQLISFGVPFLIGVALSLDIDLLTYVLYMPMIRSFAMLPISPNGLGVREGAFVVFFTEAGLSPEAAFSLALLNLAINTLANLFGGVLYLFGWTGNDRKK
jgi:hypothetical protein